ncbi:SpoIIE family protein phosphatase [Catenovulum sediminis]|uniref:SpoIIE family protein phosphatase n=1 Tax=Catenovulum sediminis TaxID=1740262 RepID=UPI00117F80CB|nr:SpoIIE family protein phosphatase [Catenovulum sediminis]
MLEVGTGVREMAGEAVSGDQAGYWYLAHGDLLACLVDGLGHGESAFQAANQCLATVEQIHTHPISEILQVCNEELRNTRGVAIGLALIQPENNQLKYCGVGNIRATITGHHLRKLVSIGGILGCEPKVQRPILTVPFEIGKDSFVLCSDGMSADMPHSMYQCKPLYPNLNTLIDELLCQWASINDDASMMIVR